MADGRGDHWWCTDTLHFLSVLEEEKGRSVICSPASGKHTEILWQSRAPGHVLYFPLTSDQRRSNARVVSMWRKQEQLFADLLFSTARDTEHKVRSLGLIDV